MIPLPTDAKNDSAAGAAREVLYRFGATTFLDPRQGAWAPLADRNLQQAVFAAAELIRDEAAFPLEGLGLGEHSARQLDPDALFDRLPTSAEELNTEFERTFGLVACGSCPPYETDYLPSKHTFQRSHQMADVAGFYRAFGLALSPDHPDRPDHISRELEFMACLIGLQRRAGEDGKSHGEQRAMVCHNAQRRFLREHLAWWVPTFARLLELSHASGFYAAAGRFLCAFLPTERVRLGVEAVSQASAPSRIEMPEECAGCLGKMPL